MLKLNAFLFLIMICVAKCDVDFETKCKNVYRDENKNQIDVLQYCSDNLCIERCCGPGEMLFVNNTCWTTKKMFKFTKKRFPKAESRFKSINVLSSLNVNKTLNNVRFVYNQRDFNECTAEETTVKNYEILENGSMKWQDNKSKKWNHIEKLKYCIEYKTDKSSKEGKIVPDIKIIIRLNTVDDKDRKQIEAFEIVVILISSFFLMLVLVVYCLLPDLRNLSGLVLMAYTFSLLFAFINKLVLTFIKRDPPEGFCKRYSPVVYFAFLASIFWLSVLSFEVWSGIRAFRIKRRSKHADLMKFMWYNVYAWGTPLLITAIVTTLDNIVDLDIIEPRFKDCLIDGLNFDLYFKIPIGILIFINIVLFFMTAYHIWIVKRAINQRQDSKSSKPQKKKSSTYSKLSVMMGLSWFLELLPATDLLWFYVLVNLYNLLTGVAIFYWFVCDKKVLMPLCKKFNIRNKFTKKWESESSQATKSGITGSTGVPSSIVKNRPKDTNDEPDLMKNCLMEESTIV